MYVSLVYALRRVRGVRYPRARVTRWFVSYHVGAGNLTKILCKNKYS